MRKLLWQSDAWNEYLEIQNDKAALKIINRLLKDLLRQGYKTSYGKVEMLKGDFSGFASVRIDKKNRIIFQVDEFQVTIIQCENHYHDH